MSENIILSGVSGVGKDYVMQKMYESGLDFKNINLGELISEEIKNNPSLSAEENINNAFEKVRREILKERGKKVLNVYNIYGDNPSQMNSNQDRIEKLPIDKSIVIEAKPDTIVKRREQDIMSRPNRAKNTIEEIDKIQKESTKIAKDIADHKDIPFKIFYNDDNLNIKDIVDFINRDSKD